MAVSGRDGDMMVSLQSLPALLTLLMAYATVTRDPVNPFDASCSKLLLFEWSSAILV